jgi:hypothetical protein
LAPEILRMSTFGVNYAFLAATWEGAEQNGAAVSFWGCSEGGGATKPGRPRYNLKTHLPHLKPASVLLAARQAWNAPGDS